MRLTPPRDEIISLTSLRGIAALFVVFHHYAVILTPTVNIHAHTMFFRFGGVWVSFFFLLSGYILAVVYYERMRAGTADRKRFLLARLIRIYPLHLFMLLVMLAAEIAKLILEQSAGLSVGAFSEKNSPAAFFANLFLVQTWGLDMDLTWNSPAWSISVEWFCYLLFPLILLTRLLDRRIGALIVAVVCFLLWVYDRELLTWLAAKGFPSERFTSLFGGIVLFTFGMALQRLTRGWRLPNDTVLSLVQVATFAAVIYFLHVGTTNWHLLPLFTLLVLTTREDRGALAAVLKWAPIYRLGVISYSVYLTHMLFLMALSRDLDAVIPLLGELRLSVAGVWAMFFAALLATLVFSSFTYEYVERRARNHLSARWLSQPAFRRAGRAASA
jgi:peptidoglycan/LPS O-acetylase OafA/YrhL